MSLDQYSFSRVSVAVAGIPVEGWMDGDDVIKVTRGAEALSVLVGADGKAIASQSLNQSAIVEFKLKPTSTSNAQLAALELTYRHALRAVPFTFGLLDLQNGSAHFAQEAVILSPPNEITYGESATPRLWRLFCGALIGSTLGNVA